MIETVNQRLHREKQERKEAKVAKVGSALLLGGLALAAVFGPKIFDDPTQYEGSRSYTFNQFEGLDNATMQVDRDVNEVPYQEVTDHIAKMPENQKVLADGIQVGDTVEIPERAFKK